MNIIGKKNWYFLISALVIVPGIIFLLTFGLHLGIDFKGGSRMEYQISNINPPAGGQISNEEIKTLIINQNVEVSSVQKSGDESVIIRTRPISQEEKQKIQQALSEKLGEVKEVSFETVGGVVGRETLE
ncbi:hypothetical protein HYW66_01275, partial [Candidatus Microgenomates bacterium]|nr:hypothetical protein [Candidatus Microgenomates bacterium]